MKCFVCGEEDHIAHFYPNRNKSDNKSSSFSASEWAFFAVALLIVNEKLSDKKCLFYLCSGTSDHMIGKKCLLYMTNIKNLETPLEVSCSKREINKIN